MQSDGTIHGVATGGSSELPERVREGIPAEERCASTLPVGAPDERGVRAGGHGGNCVGGNGRSVSHDMAHTSPEWGPRVRSLYESPRKASEVQVGGGHYKEYAIQPTFFIEENRLTWSQGNVVKYITRYKHKNGAKDVAKAIHYAMLILEREYGTTFEEVLREE